MYHTVHQFFELPFLLLYVSTSSRHIWSPTLKAFDSPPARYSQQHILNMVHNLRPLIGGLAKATMACGSVSTFSRGDRGSAVDTLLIITNS